MTQPDYLEVRGLTVSFDGFKAVDGVDLTVFQSDLRFLIGPNGAGKTTIIDALTGLVPAAGSAQYGAVQLIGRKSHQIARLGVGRTFQTASVFTELSVLQNLDIAAGAKRSALTLLGVRRGIPDGVQQPWRPWRSPASATSRPACSPTVRSNGWRSACCWSRTHGCCCSTSPSPA